MQCRVCGRAVADGDRFCTACGTSLADEPAVPATETDAGDAASDHATVSEAGDTAGNRPTGDAAGDHATDSAADERAGGDVAGVPGVPPSRLTSVAGDPDPPTSSESAGRTPAIVPPGPEAPTGEPTADPPAATRGATFDTERSHSSSTDPTADPGAARTVPAATAPAASRSGGPDAPTERITAPVEPVPSDDTTGGWGDDDPVWAATGPVETVPSPPVATPVIVPAYPDDDVPDPATEPRIEPVAAAAPTAVITTPTPAPTATVDVPVVPTAIRERQGFRFSAVTLLSVVGAIVTLFAMFATIVTVSSDDRIVGNENTPVNFRIGGWIPGDLADNLPIAGLIAVALLVSGGVAAGFGWRGGSGLAAGSGLAIAGLSALTIGLAQIPIDAAYEMARIPTDERFTLTITRDVGYWLQLAAGVIGIVVFFASLNDAVGDGRRGLNPWIAALGALSGVVMAAGPLIPEGLAVFSDNWYVTEGPGQPPAMLLSMRLVQLSLLALTSLIGFLTVRRWGLGVAVGGALPSLWLLISTLFELTDHPVGPGFRNPGATDMTVHGVTLIGASALAAFLILALVAAYDQAQHEW